MTDQLLLAAAFLWGLAEGAVFFVVPDVLLTLLAIFSTRLGFAACLCALAGELIAGALLYLVSARNHSAAQQFVAKVPFVRASMWEKVRSDFETRGWLAIRKGPTRGIPYKLYAVEAPSHLRLSVFLLASIPGRLERFLILTSVAALAAWPLHHRIEVDPLGALAVHLTVWTIFYIRYWSTI